MTNLNDEKGFADDSDESRFVSWKQKPVEKEKTQINFDKDELERVKIVINVI